MCSLLSRTVSAELLLHFVDIDVDRRQPIFANQDHILIPDLHWGRDLSCVQCKRGPFNLRFADVMVDRLDQSPGGSPCLFVSVEYLRASSANSLG